MVALLGKGLMSNLISFLESIGKQLFGNYVLLGKK